MGVERLGRRSRTGQVADPANLDDVISDAIIGTAIECHLNFDCCGWSSGCCRRSGCRRSSTAT